MTLTMDHRVLQHKESVQAYKIDLARMNFINQVANFEQLIDCLID